MTPTQVEAVADEAVAGVEVQQIANREGRRMVVPVASLKVAPERNGGSGPSRKQGKVDTAPGFVGTYTDAAGQMNVVIGVDRFLRARASGLKEIEVFDFGPLEPRDARALALYAVLGREKSEAFSTARTLHDFVSEMPEGTSSRDVAKLFGSTHTTVLRYSKLWDLPPQYFEAGLQGRLKASHAYRVLRITDETERNERLALLVGDEEQHRAAARDLRDLARQERVNKGYDYFKVRLAGVEAALKSLSPDDRNRAIHDMKAATRRMVRMSGSPAAAEVAHV